MKKTVSKADMRRELHRQMERFLRTGGVVEEIPQGLSGREPGDLPLASNRSLFLEPRAPRTLIPEVVAAIEARRRENAARKSPTGRRRNASQRQRKVIYDDFGEPLRRVWVDE